MSRRTAAIGLALTAVLAACATPESRIRGGLMRIGLSEPISACMADRMADRLSLQQLDRLNRLGKLRKRKAGDISFNEFAHLTRGLQDPEIIAVVTSSGLVCAVP